MDAAKEKAGEYKKTAVIVNCLRKGQPLLLIDEPTRRLEISLEQLFF